MTRPNIIIGPTQCLFYNYALQIGRKSTSGQCVGRAEEETATWKFFTSAVSFLLKMGAEQFCSLAEEKVPKCYF